MHGQGRPTRNLARATVVVALLFVASRFLGLARDILIAARFGTSADYDAYVAAFRIPDLVFLVVMSGAFGSAFIPVYSEFLAQKHRTHAWQLANTLLSATLTLFFSVSLLVIVFAEPLVRYIVAPGLAPETRALAANLTRLLMLSPLFLGIGAAAKAMLESEARFTEPALAPLLYNAGIIAGTVFLAPIWGIYGLAIGVVTGAITYALFQSIVLRSSGWHFAWTIRLNTPGVHQVLHLMGPRLLAQVATQMNLLILTNFASRIGEQSIAALQYAYQIFLLPHGIFALSLATVLFPTLSQQRARGELAELQSLIGRAARSLTLVSLLSIVLLVCFAQGIVQTIFQFGAFTATSTQLVSQALQWFAPGLLAYALVELFTRLSYAFLDSRAPVIAAMAAVLFNLIGSLLLMPILGHRGLALSLAMATTAELFILIHLVRLRTKLSLRSLTLGLWRAIPATFIVLGLALFLSDPVTQFTTPENGRTIWQPLVLIGCLSVLSSIFIGIGLLFRQNEIVQGLTLLKVIVYRPARRFLLAILDR